MYVAGRIGWPRGFYFQGTFWMTEKKHGAICATQHAGGSLLVFLFLFFPNSLFLLWGYHPEVPRGEAQKDSGGF